MINIQVEGVEEIRKRMSDYPKKFDEVIGKTLDTSLLTIHQEVPPYPVYQSSYRRTGTLGRTLTPGQNNNINERKIGPQMFEATFGTRLNYAPYVIGEQTQAGHMKHWWTLDGTVLRKAAPKIERLFQIAVERMAKWLEGKGL